MILAAGSGCEGCGGGRYYTSDEVSDTVDSVVPETPLRVAYEEVYSSDIQEEEREEEEMYQSETEDESSEENGSETETESEQSSQTDSI